MCAGHIICPNHGFAIARRIRQIAKPFCGSRGQVASVRNISNGNLPCNHLGARVADRDISGSSGGT
jgi:hypothetical protein